MWTRFLNSRWFERLFTSAFAIICVLLAQRIIAGRENESSLKTEFEKRPTYEYVDKQDAALKGSIDNVEKVMIESDKQIKTDLIISVEEINTNLREVRNYIYSTKNGSR